MGDRAASREAPTSRKSPDARRATILCNRSAVMNQIDQPWPIWKVLAWVLTRDQEFAERAGPQDFAPDRADEEYVSHEEVAKAWRLLHNALVAGSIELLPLARTCDPNQPSPHTDNARQISTNVVHSLTWDWLTANVEASSQEVLRYFSAGKRCDCSASGPDPA